MAIGASQMRCWLKQWREEAGLTQLTARDAAGVGLKVVTGSEQRGKVGGVHLLALVMAYKAEFKLAEKIREWRERGGEVLAVSHVGGGIQPTVNQERATEETAPLPPETHRPLEVAKPKKGKGKRGA